MEILTIPSPVTREGRREKPCVTYDFMKALKRAGVL